MHRYKFPCLFSLYFLPLFLFARDTFGQDNGFSRGFGIFLIGVTCLLLLFSTIVYRHLDIQLGSPFGFSLGLTVFSICGIPSIGYPLEGLLASSFVLMLSFIMMLGVTNEIKLTPSNDLGLKFVAPIVATVFMLRSIVALFIYDIDPWVKALLVIIWFLVVIYVIYWNLNTFRYTFYPRVSEGYALVLPVICFANCLLLTQGFMVKNVILSAIMIVIWLGAGIWVSPIEEIPLDHLKTKV